MPKDRFLISFTGDESGIQTDVKPWLIADNAFRSLKNAYVYRGRLRKRFGSILMGLSQRSSRLRILLGTTNGAGNLAGNVPVAAPNYYAIGQQFSVGEELFTVNAAAGAMLASAGSAGTFDTTTGAYTITGADINTSVYYYPSLPVMGIDQFESQPINDEPTFAFDTRFAYAYDSTINGFIRLTGGTDTWSGNDTNFFWTTNSTGATPDLTLFWATNYTTADGIRYWQPTALANPLIGTWATPTLQYADNAPGPNNIITARIIVQFKNRLVFLNTIESVDGVNTTYVNRCRYSAVGSPLAANAWRQDVPGNGSAIDAPTQEAIITAQFLKDRLIVFFERSTWELVYTGNQVFPFTWQLINTELGAESTFSQVPFDKVVLGVGNVGIHACTGTNVERIDTKIPQLISRVHNLNSGVQRVNGIRDYFSELVYWTYPGINRDASFPFCNQVLVYNYKNNSWAINDDSFTTFGYFQVDTNTPGDTWGATAVTWGELGEPWNSGASNPKVRQTVAGNQQGWVHILSRDITRNAQSLQVTSVDTATNTLTIINHNLDLNQYILLENMNGLTMTDQNGNVVTSLIVMVESNPVASNEPNTVVVNGVTFAGAYTGGGTAARVSTIDILSKQYNFYAPQDRNTYVSRIDFFVKRTDDGEITLEYFTSSANQELVDQGTVTGATLGNFKLQTSAYDPDLVPYEQFKTRLWHPLYPHADGESVQIRLYFDDEQMRDTAKALADFQLHAMTFFAQPTASRLQ